MAQKAVATLGTGAITAGSQAGVFTLDVADFKGGKPLVTIDGLDGSETASLYVQSGDNWKVANDTSGSPIVFAVDSEAYAFEVAGTFAFIKDASASALTVYVDNGR